MPGASMYYTMDDMTTLHSLHSYKLHILTSYIFPFLYACDILSQKRGYLFGTEAQGIYNGTCENSFSHPIDGEIRFDLSH